MDYKDKTNVKELLEDLESLRKRKSEAYTDCEDAIRQQQQLIESLQAALQTAKEENGRLKEANILLKNGAADYEKQIKKMRRNLRRWCIANHIKLNDEAPDILLDS